MERVRELHSAAYHLQQSAAAMSKAFHHLEMASVVLTPPQEPRSVYDGRYEYGYVDDFHPTPYNSDGDVKITEHP
jgi:hypothetical protein